MASARRKRAQASIKSMQPAAPPSQFISGPQADRALSSISAPEAQEADSTSRLHCMLGCMQTAKRSTIQTFPPIPRRSRANIVTQLLSLLTCAFSQKNLPSGCRATTRCDVRPAFPKHSRAFSSSRALGAALSAAPGNEGAVSAAVCRATRESIRERSRLLASGPFDAWMHEPRGTRDSAPATAARPKTILLHREQRVPENLPSLHHVTQNITTQSSSISNTFLNVATSV